MTVLACYAERHADRWSAICLDLDIAVEAGSLRQARKALEAAISDYLQDAMAAPAEERSYLLSRRAPWHVWAACIAKAIWARLLYSDRINRWRLEGAAVPCPV